MQSEQAASGDGRHVWQECGWYMRLGGDCCVCASGIVSCGLLFFVAQPL